MIATRLFTDLALPFFTRGRGDSVASPTGTYSEADEDVEVEKQFRIEYGGREYVHVS